MDSTEMRAMLQGISEKLDTMIYQNNEIIEMFKEESEQEENDEYEDEDIEVKEKKSKRVTKKEE